MTKPSSAPPRKPRPVAQPKRKLRIAHVVIQPILMWDDGQELSPGPQTSPITVALSDLDGMANRLRAETAAAEASQA